MTAFAAKRIVRSYTHTVNRAASDIFPLLCPIREYDWIEPWNCEMIWSESGIAENNCIFKTDLPGRGTEIWTVSRYEPDVAIEFVRFCTDQAVIKLDVTLHPTMTNITEIQWTHVSTGLNEAGNLWVEEQTDSRYRKEMQGLENRLTHFLETGDILKDLHQ